jgi:excisionase family DNA binding protein
LSGSIRCDLLVGAGGHALTDVGDDERMDELLTVDDVSRITRLSKYTIRATIREGELKATKLRGRFLVEPADLEAWIDAGRVRPDPVIPRPFDVPSGGYQELAKRRRASRPPDGAREGMKELSAREAVKRRRTGST